MGKIMKNKSVLFVLLICALWGALGPGTAKLFLAKTSGPAWDLLKAMPPILVLMGLLGAWAPLDWIESRLGKGSGARGMFYSMLLGAIAAGPLLVAFPLGASLRAKGASAANVAIFLGAWSTMKIPMLMLEASFLGPRFSLWRLALTAPFLLVIGFLVGKFAPWEQGPGPRAPGRGCP